MPATSLANRAIQEGYNVSLEHPEVLAARLRQEGAKAASDLEREGHEAWNERLKSLLVFLVLLTAVAVTFLICAIITFGAGWSPEEKKWASSLLTIIISAGVGYLTGKKSK